MGAIVTGPDVESQIGDWREYLRRHRGIVEDDVAEMEDHLREQILDLNAVGLSSSEAFLIAIGRLGAVDELSREFARVHSERLWKQLALSPDAAAPAHPGRELMVVLALAVGAAVAVKTGLTFLSEVRFGVVASVVIAPFLAGYFGWKRGIRLRAAVGIAALLVLTAVVLGAYPYAQTAGVTGVASTAVTTAIHAPIVAWLVVGIAYMGGVWRSSSARMDFLRFSGEFAVYYALLALGGGAIVALTVGSFAAVGVAVTGFMVAWVIPAGMSGAVLVSAWLVEAKQDVIENIAPVLTRVFMPLTGIMLLALLGAYTLSRGAAGSDRTLLILMDLTLVLVLGLVIYAISAREPDARAGVFDWIELIVVVAALLADALVLAAVVGRVVHFGTSPNKITALGVNGVLLVNLLWTAWLSLGHVLGRRTLGTLQRWQTDYLPVFAIWSAAMIVVLPVVFRFS